MKRWRISLDGLPEYDRPRFLSELVDRLAEAFGQQFPPASGYLHAGGWRLAPCVNPKKSSPAIQQACQMASWRISRGRFWGLQVSVVPEDVALRSLKIRIDGYFPIFQGILERLERLRELPGRERSGDRVAQAIWGHFLGPILFLLGIALLPLLAVDRLGMLSLRSDVLVAAGQLESLWPEVQASWPVAVSLSRPLSPTLVYSLALALAAGAAVGCFGLAGLEITGAGWRTALYVAGGILGFVSLVLLIGLIMTILGFEAEP